MYFDTLVMQTDGTESRISNYINQLDKEREMGRLEKKLS